MTDFEIAEKILLANGFVEECKYTPHLHKYRKTYSIPGQSEIVATKYVYVDHLKTHPKECISFLGFDWDAEVAKLSTKDFLTMDQKIAIIKACRPTNETGTWTHMEVLPKTPCSHAWKSYTGLSESFEFCEKCDERRLR